MKDKMNQTPPRNPQATQKLIKRDQIIKAEMHNVAEKKDRTEQGKLNHRIESWENAIRTAAETHIEKSDPPKQEHRNIQGVKNSFKERWALKHEAKIPEDKTITSEIKRRLCKEKHEENMQNLEDHLWHYKANKVSIYLIAHETMQRRWHTMYIERKTKYARRSLRT